MLPEHQNHRTIYVTCDEHILFIKRYSHFVLVLTSSCCPAGNVAFLAAVRLSSVRNCTFMEGGEGGEGRGLWAAN